MDPERWARVRHIFDSAAELEPEQRPAYLESACQGDTVMLAEVRAMRGIRRAA